MKALYFAWVRERIGKAEEEIAPPENIKTVAELMAWLGGQGKTTPPPSRISRRYGRRSTARTSSTMP